MRDSSGPALLSGGATVLIPSGEGPTGAALGDYFFYPVGPAGPRVIQSRLDTGLSAAGLHNDNGVWRAKGSGGGDVILRFTGHNAFGVMDHTVCLRSGGEIHVPMRVVANGDGAEVMLTLFRQPGVSVEAFEHDANWVRRDLAQLREMLTG